MQDDRNTWPHRIAILGVGLLGGSVALALRRARPEAQIVGLVRNQSSAQRLLDLDIVHTATESMEEACRGCDVVVVATPVDRIASLVVQAADLSGPDCLITDVGSTKANIVASVARFPQASAKFLAAHPIAGSEKTGAEYATAGLMEGKVVVLTPQPETPPMLLRRAVEFWQLTGGVIHQMSAQQHDAHLAAVSHVPHLVSALVARLPGPDARPLVGSGWQDMTRVAAGDPELWTAICRENREAILGELNRFATELDRLKQVIDRHQDDELTTWLAEAKELKQQSI